MNCSRYNLGQGSEVCRGGSEEIHLVLMNYLNLIFPQLLVNISRAGDNQIFCLFKGDSSVFVDFLYVLKWHTNLQFTSLLDIICVDSLRLGSRFQLTYHLLSSRFNVRLNLSLNVGQNFFVNTVGGLFSSSEWLEREIWDMFGIFFRGHVDLRRVLTDYGFESFPLRRDFPMVGFVEVCYSEVQKRIVFEPVELVQGFRTFDLKTSWVSNVI